jgi:hypothetical protein
MATMSEIFRKLNLSTQQAIAVLHAPPSFEPELAQLPTLHLHRTLPAEIPFALAFVTRQAEVDALSPRLDAAIPSDGILWLAYPKTSSKKLKCDFNRDTGWAALKSLGWDTVRAISIDADWTALRFRRNQFIKPRSGTQKPSQP